MSVKNSFIRITKYRPKKVTYGKLLTNNQIINENSHVGRWFQQKPKIQRPKIGFWETVSLNRLRIFFVLSLNFIFSLFLKFKFFKIPFHFENISFSKAQFLINKLCIA